MTKMNDPQDVLGIAVRNLLNYRDSRGELEPLVAKWKKTVVIEITGIYAVSVHFNGTEIQIEPGGAAKFDLKVLMPLEMMIAIAKSEIGIMHAFMIGQLKVKKMWHIGTLLKFVKIFIPALKIAGERGVNLAKSHRS
nr:SCP2 sterol-binding domain-containing protein [Candidatus Sigynarchaeota archaeon]